MLLSDLASVCFFVCFKCLFFFKEMLYSDSKYLNFTMVSGSAACYMKYLKHKE